jgi:hypothetical protein
MILFSQCGNIYWAGFSIQHAPNRLRILNSFCEDTMDKTSPVEEAAELRELRAQVRALQSEISQLRDSKSRRRGTGREDARYQEERRADEREISDKLRDILDRGGDEASRLMRAIVVGSLEHLQLWAKELEDFTRRVNERNRPAADDSADDLARRLPSQVASEFLETVRRSLDFPQRAVDRMRDSYDETENLPTRTRREPNAEREVTVAGTLDRNPKTEK